MSNSQGLLCAGNLYIEMLTAAGVGGGLFGPINTTKLEIKPTSENKLRTSMKKETFGQTADSVTIPGATEISITLDEQPTEIVEMALAGTSEVINHEAGNIAAEVAVLVKGRWTEFSLSNVTTAGLLVTNTDDTDAELGLGVDYEINYQLGMIKPIAGGAVEDGGNVKITAASNAYTGTRVKAGIALGTKYRVILDGENLVNGKSIKLTVGKCSLAPNNGLDFMSSDYVSTELTGQVEIPQDGIAPYFFDEVDA